MTYREYNPYPITNSLRHFFLPKLKFFNDILLKRPSFMSLLSFWPCSSGNFNSVLWDMQIVQNFTLLLLHKDPKSKTPARDVDCPPRLVWPAPTMCSCSRHTSCPFTPQSHCWPVPAAPPTLPRKCSIGRFDRLNRYYIQATFTELGFAEV